MDETAGIPVGNQDEGSDYHDLSRGQQLSTVGREDKMHAGRSY